MRDVAELLNAMRDAGVIMNYALFGATAQMRYTEPVATLDADVHGVPLRVVSAAHLAAIALSTGRAKDFARVLALLESQAVDASGVETLARAHGLDEVWRRFKTRFLDA